MDEQMALFLRALSTVFGWTYVLCWSLSFYPQPLLNWRRKSTQGLTADFPALNVVGFVSYTILTSSFLYSPKIREQYAARHPHAPEPTVRFNDFAFAVHAMFMVLLTYSQLFSFIWRFHVPKSSRTSTPVRIIVLGSILAVIVSIFTAVSNDRKIVSDPKVWTWIDVIYVFGYIKLISTFTKYIPQVWMNYQNQSTQGWSIGQILFDFAGGILSLSQLLLDASFQGDWSGVTGNPAKFGLSNISMMFDVMFIVQHYILYRNAGRGKKSETSDDNRDADNDSTEPLLTHD